MGYQILPAIIFFCCIFGIIFIVLKKLPNLESSETKPDSENRGLIEPHHKLSAKGLPILKFSKLKFHGVFWIKKIWRFVLEAKEIIPSGTSVLKIKQLFIAKAKLPDPNQTLETEENELIEKTEADYFAEIKKEPKNLSHYDNLGRLYLSQNKFSDAKDIYLYLTSHDSASPDFWARLGVSAFRSKDFILAIAGYKNSTALDSGKPNRYYNLALSHKSLGQISEAKEALKKALEIDPANFKFLELQKRLDN